jgi:phosphohistidine swiveling domain-containing protein
MELLVGLDTIGDDDGDRVGGKAVALAALQRTGHPVPRSLCLTTEAYELFVDRASLRAVIHQELGRKSFEDMRWEEIWDVALRIRNRFLRAPVPKEVIAGVEACLADEGSDAAFAVRSSAPGEDSDEVSFAGLHDSFVGVSGVSAVIDAIRGVWASLWSDRALLYRRELGINVDTSSMAVVIQELVDGAVSGIAFGIHPTDPELAVVESVYGLNQGLVDGTIEPDRWTIDRTTGRMIAHTPPSDRRRLVAQGSRTQVEQVPAALADTPPLDEDDLARVFDAARAAEALFGAPQDVEWTIAGGRLVLLQSRPVTTSTAGEGDKRAWYLSLTRSLDNLRGLRERVESDLLPAMDREADEVAERDLVALDGEGLADEIERRRAIHDRWVDVYWRDFIPLAHGIRLFGQFYNDIVRPDDPYEFMELLAATPMLSVRRNGELERIASLVRENPEVRDLLERGQPADSEFELELEGFQREFGDTVFADQQCFGDRARLVRLLLSMADVPAAAVPASAVDVENRTEAFIESVEIDRRELARELVDIGRVSYRLRDDDNIHLSRLEGLVLAAVEEGRRRLGEQHGGGLAVDLEDVVRALRHPNLVVEPKTAPQPPGVEPGFRARPRQLVGQPAGPGVTTAVARVIEDVDDLFEFQAGEVLVCDAVDPNMTFVVPMASAVVERRGGMLIHGAIIAREYGLPCVTGVPDITSLVATGDRLTVDGYLGIVTVAAPVDRVV